jgi:HEAT repeat protein
MRDEEAEVRFRAAKALGDLGGREAIGSLVEALDEPSRWSSIRIADILADMGGGVAREIVDHYDTLSPAARPLVLDILARREAGERREWIRERAADDDRDVRARACHALGVVGDADGDGALLRERVRDAEWPVRALAAKSLGRLGVRDAVPELADALRDREWWVRANAAEALRALGEPGLAQLEAMVDDDDVYASHQAVLMLQLEGRLDERLEDLAGTDDEKRRRGETILRSLVELGQTSYLRELAAQHRLPAVRESIERALTAAAGSREATP